VHFQEAHQSIDGHCENIDDHKIQMDELDFEVVQKLVSINRDVED